MMFDLQPFPSKKHLQNLQITGNIERNSNRLIVGYVVRGDLKQIAIAKRAVRRIATPSNTPARKHELWEETCFEFFLGIKNYPQYWEFNLSPAGDWNVYHFDGYRQGMQEEIAFTTLPFSVDNQADSLTISIDVDLDKIVAEEQLLDVAITTVIKQKNGDVSYWALTHRGAEADFHLRESFVLEM